MGYHAAGDLWRHSKGLWIMLEIRTLGIFSSWAAHRFCGGMIGTIVFGILGPIPFFPLKTCFWKPQYMFPKIFWIERFYGYQSSGQVKNQTSKKFLLQKYVTRNCDILQKYSAYEIWIPKFLFGDVTTDDVTKWAFWLCAVLIQKRRIWNNNLNSLNSLSSIV